MNIMFKKIINWFKRKETIIEPIFKIEIKESRFSTDWVYIRYSNDNGRNWYVITRGERDIDCMKWNKYKIDTLYIRITDIQDFMINNHFNSFEDCVKYNDDVVKWVEEHNEKYYKEYLGPIKAGKEFIENFNKK